MREAGDRDRLGTLASMRPSAAEHGLEPRHCLAIDTLGGNAPANESMTRASQEHHQTWREANPRDHPIHNPSRKTSLRAAAYAWSQFQDNPTKPTTKSDPTPAISTCVLISMRSLAACQCFENFRHLRGRVSQDLPSALYLNKRQVNPGFNRTDARSHHARCPGPAHAMTRQGP